MPGPAEPPTSSHGRCRCGHLPTHHMVVAAALGSYRLDPSGPCTVCGEAGCRKYSPVGR